MSRIGKRSVAIPSGVTATIENGSLIVKVETQLRLMHLNPSYEFCAFNSLKCTKIAV